MERTVLCALLLSAAMTITVVNDYQERQLYYSEDENVCTQGSGFDWVNLYITLDGNFFNEVTIKTRTYCSQWGNKYATQLRTASKWSYFDDDNQLMFEDAERRVDVEGELIAVIQKTTVLPEGVLNRNPCKCTILGNGEILRYGGSSLRVPPTIRVSCTSLQK